MSDIEKDLFATEMQVDKPNSGRFRILRYHARGGLGQIAIALDQEFQREIALKSIREEYSDSELHQEKFNQEATVSRKATDWLTKAGLQTPVDMGIPWELMT